MKNKLKISLILLAFLAGNFGFILETSAYVPNDPFYIYQSVLQRINIANTWDITTGSDEIVIAIIDTGIDVDHPDLAENIWINEREEPGDGIDNDANGYIDDIYGWDFIHNNYDVQPDYDINFVGGVNHGTVVASILAAVGDNNEGIAGVSYRSKIMPLEVMDVDGVGDVYNTIKAIDYAIDNGADIINMSFVGHDYSPEFESAVRRAYEAGIFVVAAAGNDTMNNGGDDLTELPSYPICLDRDDEENFVIGVAAVDENGIKTEFSNYGGGCVDVSAPGTKLFAAMAYNGEVEGFDEIYGGYWTGTSVATPLVSGAIALIKSINPSMPYGQVIDALIRGADDVDSLNPEYAGQLGFGIIDIAESIELINREMESYKQSKYIVTGAGIGEKPKVKIFKSNGYLVSEFMAFPENVRGGLNIAVGNVAGGPDEEIIVIPKAGDGPHLRIFDKTGKLLGQYFVYDKNFRGGVNLAVGDLDHGGYDEIVVSPMGNMKPLTRVFDSKGNLKSEFLAYDESMTDGLSVAVVDRGYWNSGQILTGPGKGSGPQISLFDINGNVKARFFAFLENFHGGVNVSAGDIDGDSVDEIVVGVASEVDSYVRIFDIRGFLKIQTMAFPSGFRGGVNLGMADLNNDGKEEIIFGAGPGGGPQVRIFSGNVDLMAQFFAYSMFSRGGVSVGAIEEF